MKGRYKAKKVGGDFGYTNGGKEQVAVAFQLSDTGDSLTWYGYFTEKTEENTLHDELLCPSGASPVGLSQGAARYSALSHGVIGV